MPVETIQLEERHDIDDTLCLVDRPEVTRAVEVEATPRKARCVVDDDLSQGSALGEEHLAEGGHGTAGSLVVGSTDADVGGAHSEPIAARGQSAIQRQPQVALCSAYLCTDARIAVQTVGQIVSGGRQPAIATANGDVRREGTRGLSPADGSRHRHYGRLCCRTEHRQRTQQCEKQSFHHRGHCYWFRWRSYKKNMRYSFFPYIFFEI